jgi:formylglycine-generating enzyme required for sulfatase activity
MVGNVWEWTHSKFEKYPYQAQDGREKEDETSMRVLRGGSFNATRGGARCAFRRGYSPSDRRGYSGFRVVVSPILNYVL